jgi:hypothetical protein
MVHGWNIRKQNGELIATNAGNRIPIPNRTAYPPADLAQESVPNRMAGGIVDQLEVLEVNQ